MKKLQEKSEKLPGAFPLHWVETLASGPSTERIILLLHGLNERGLRIHRKLAASFPPDAHVLAPTAPFPLPRLKSEKIDYGYTWYFFNKYTQNYDVDQSFAISLIQELLKKTNPKNLPVTIIGFSQGGYLAPALAKHLTNVERIIGIGCEFRPIFFEDQIDYELIGIHGVDDDIIPLDMAKKCINELKAKGIQAKFIEVPESKHEINKSIALTVKEIIEYAK